MAAAPGADATIRHSASRAGRLAAVSILGALLAVACPFPPARAQAPPEPPATITVPKADADGAYTVKWGASGTADATYVLQESTKPSFVLGVRTFPPTAALSQGIRRRRSGKTYYYRVKAVKAGSQDSAWRTGAAGCAVPGSSRVRPPAGISAPASDADGNFTVKWKASGTAGAVYVLEEATTPDFTAGWRIAYSGKSLRKEITGGSQGATYHYRVRAVKPGLRDSRVRTAAAGCLVTSLELEPYAYKAYLQPGGPLETVFTMDKPRGWDVDISGMCSTLAFLIRDPAEPLRQIFYFGEIYPVYVDAAAKAQDQYLCSLVTPPCPLTWVDAPVVNPFTVENFFSHWPQIAGMRNATAFMPDFPPLHGIEIIAAAPQAPMMGAGETTLLRGVLTDGAPGGARAGQGQFLASVVPDVFFGKGGGRMVFGATAPLKEFKASEARMVASLNSFTVSGVYYNWCVAQLQQTWGAVAQAGRTLSEASDIIWEGWQGRTAAQDVMAYRYDDTLRGVEKLWDPASGNVYEFAAGFHDQYSQNPSAYNVTTLESMPDGRVDLWEGPVLDGPAYVY